MRNGGACKWYAEASYAFVPDGSQNGGGQKLCFIKFVNRSGACCEDCRDAIPPLFKHSG
jgi:hypothetical protein